MPHRRASDLSAAERAEILRHSEVGSGLSEETLLLLADGSEAVDYRRRRFIYRTGDTADALYCIARGRVKICSIDAVTARAMQ
jgi:CRP-like cAMP-binding protein